MGSLPGGSQGDHRGGSGVGRRQHLHPTAERLPEPRGDYGSPLQACDQLGAFQQSWYEIMPGGSGNGPKQWPQAADLPPRLMVPVHLD